MCKQTKLEAQVHALQRKVERGRATETERVSLSRLQVVEAKQLAKREHKVREERRKERVYGY